MPLARPGASPRLWQVSLSRTALAAAFGAIAAVILLALQPINETLTREAATRSMIVAAFVGALGAAVVISPRVCPSVIALEAATFSRSSSPSLASPAATSFSA